MAERYLKEPGGDSGELTPAQTKRIFKSPKEYAKGRGLINPDSLGLPRVRANPKKYVGVGSIKDKTGDVRIIWDQAKEATKDTDLSLLSDLAQGKKVSKDANKKKLSLRSKALNEDPSTANIDTAKREMQIQASKTLKKNPLLAADITESTVNEAVAKGDLSYDDGELVKEEVMTGKSKPKTAKQKKLVSSFANALRNMNTDLLAGFVAEGAGGRFLDGVAVSQQTAEQSRLAQKQNMDRKTLEAKLRQDEIKLDLAQRETRLKEGKFAIELSGDNQLNLIKTDLVDAAGLPVMTDKQTGKFYVQGREVAAKGLTNLTLRKNELRQQRDAIKTAEDQKRFDFEVTQQIVGMGRALRTEPLYRANLDRLNALNTIQHSQKFVKAGNQIAVTLSKVSILRGVFGEKKISDQDWDTLAAPVSLRQSVKDIFSRKAKGKPDAQYIKDVDNIVKSLSILTKNAIVKHQRKALKGAQAAYGEFVSPTKLRDSMGFINVFGSRPVGTRVNVDGEQAEWDGKKWVPVK